MKLRHPKSSLVVSCILTVALTFSPLLTHSTAAQGLKPDATAADESIPNAEPNISHDTLSSAAGEAGNREGTSVPLALPATGAGAPFPTVPGRSTSTAASAPAPKSDRDRRTAESKWLILAALITAGAVVAVILLWPHGKDKVPTVIAPGTPTVGTPTR